MVSFVALADEVVLTRVFAVAQWHHFAYMMISLAMLGFGASGTVLALWRPRLIGRESRLLGWATFCFAVSVSLCYGLSQRVPCEAIRLARDRSQLGWLLVLYLVLAVPFFLASTCITLGFFLQPRRVGRIYFVNLLGSGLGAAAVVGLLYLRPVHEVSGLLGLVAGLSWLVLVAAGGRGQGAAVVPHRNGCLSRCAGVLVIVWAALGPGHTPVRVSEYKGLAGALRLPDVEVVARAWSPLSEVTAVRSTMIRETPGQISGYPWRELGPLPPQIGLFFDAGSVSVVNRFDGSLAPFAFLDYVTSAVSYRLVDRPYTVVLGAGGGTDVLGALAHGARRVVALEVDPSVFRLCRGPLREFAGGLYDRPEVEAHVAEGRGWLQATDQRFDLLQIALLDSFSAAAAGTHALSESYLYTVEAVRLYLDRLFPGGVLAVTRWLKTPPRDAIKMFATAVEAAEAAGLAEPWRHLAMLRSWNTATIVVARSPLTTGQIEAVRGFAAERELDVCYYPGIRREETNQFTILDRPEYYEAAEAILFGDRRAFYRDHLFYVQPATDDRPYYFRFFKLSSLPVLRQSLGAEVVPFVEWGTVVLVATLAQSAAAGALLILLPLAVLGRLERRRSALVWTVLYFGLLGLAFMSLEIAFIQKLMLFLAYPVYAVAVVLTAFLVFSGVGSWYIDRRAVKDSRLVLWAVLGIAVAARVYATVLPPLFAAWAGWPDAARIVVGVVLLAPLAFCMGIPFPTGLQLVADRHAPLLPWAWGINGCASVTGATLATLTAVYGGFGLVVPLAVVGYLLAVVVLVRLELAEPHPQSPGTT